MAAHIGKVGEHLVLAELIRRDIEAYSAISFRQPDYDVTVVRSDLSVARIQVKATELGNSSTNNPVPNLEKNYDYLVLVVLDDSASRFFVLTKAEVVVAYASPGVLYTTMQRSKKYAVRDYLLHHENKWEKILQPLARAPFT